LDWLFSAIASIQISLVAIPIMAGILILIVDNLIIYTESELSLMPYD